MTVTIISGANLRDDIFEVDASIIGEAVTWNVTRIQRDAEQGAFGKLVAIPMSALPTMTPAMAQRIDWKKVEGMLGVHLHRPGESPLEDPALQVAVLRGDGVTMRIPVDGNHRICARRIVGYPEFFCWVVPAKLERLYRVTTAEMPQ